MRAAYKDKDKDESKDKDSDSDSKQRHKDKKGIRNESKGYPRQYSESDDPLM